MKKAFTTWLLTIILISVSILIPESPAEAATKAVSLTKSSATLKITTNGSKTKYGTTTITA